MSDQTCPFSTRISALYDGELSGSDRAEIEQHLKQGCGVCQSELDAIAELAAWVRMESPLAMDAVAMDRLHGHVESMVDRSMLRFAQLLSGVAAALLIGACGWLWGQSSHQTVPASGWEHAAVTLRPDPVTDADYMGDARWIVSQLSVQR